MRMCRPDMEAARPNANIRMGAGRSRGVRMLAQDMERMEGVSKRSYGACACILDVRADMRGLR